MKWFNHGFFEEPTVVGSVGNRFSFNGRAQTALILAVIIFLGVAQYVGFAQLLESVGQRGTLPLLTLASRVVNTWEQPFFTAKRAVNAAKRIQMLEYRYSELLAQLSDLEGLRRENEELRRILENSDRQLRETVVTVPITSYGGPSIGAGSKSAIEEGDAVVIAGMMVGRVGRVSDDFALVNLLASENFTPVVAQTPQGVKGIVQGNGRRVVFSEIPVEATLSADERVMTTGQLGVGQGLLLGQIGKKISSDADATGIYELHQLVDFYEARVVEVYKE